MNIAVNGSDFIVVAVDLGCVGLVLLVHREVLALHDVQLRPELLPVVPRRPFEHPDLVVVLDVGCCRSLLE
jgi:hypothetical protein